MAIKGALYKCRTTGKLKAPVEFYCSQTFRSALMAIQRGNSQLTQDIIVLINRVVTAQRTCTLQWIPYHVDIFANKQADNLTKEARNSPQLSNSLTLTDAVAIARRKLNSHSVRKHIIPFLNCNLLTSTTTARINIP
ncbi:RNase H domain-containing protein [Trichonephila clavipes]|nr:RNase H domain-containing protein [Trichonephila clavipes]